MIRLYVSWVVRHAKDVEASYRTRFHVRRTSEGSVFIFLPRSGYRVFSRVAIFVASAVGRDYHLTARRWQC